ncbi:hypothetical protein OQA88_1170 [Cercophora sp. LCS_1]
MGGFIIDLKSLDVGILETGCLGASSQLVVMPYGVELLVRCGYLPDISKKEIEDKNKVDIFSKAICCVQVGWFIFQSLERFRLQLPLSLLEVHTLAHVACALVLYGLWWHKPKMILKPTQIPSAEGLDQLVAFMFMASQLSAPDRPGNMVMKKFAKPELAFMDLFVPPHQTARAQGSREATTESHGNFRYDPVRRLREELARKALLRFPSLSGYIQDLVTDNASNWPDHGLLRDSGDGIMGTCVWLASVVYGAIHFLCWTNNFVFPSDREMWVWMASAGYLIFSGVLWATLVGLDWQFAGCLWFWGDLLQGTSGKAARCSLIPLMILGGTLNAAARLFLFAESFASLRATLAQVYTSPRWSASTPHL